MTDLERKAKEDRERSLTFLTETEYWSLPYYGTWLLDWMARWRPKACQRLKDEGKITAYFEEKGTEITDILADNYETLGLSGGLEIARDLYFGNPEPDADKYWGIEAY